MKEGDFDKQLLCDNISGYFIVFQGIGEGFGPLVSTLLEIQLTFRPTQKVLAVYSSLFLIIYYLICSPYDFFKVKENNKKEVGNEINWSCLCIDKDQDFVILLKLNYWINSKL